MIATVLISVCVSVFVVCAILVAGYLYIDSCNPRR
jgi:hypothetical protein